MAVNSLGVEPNPTPPNPNPPCNLLGSFGLAVVQDGVSTNAVYVQDNTPNAETTIRARWLLNTETLVFDPGEEMMYSLRGPSGPAVDVVLSNTGSSVRVRAFLRKDDLTWARTTGVTLYSLPNANPPTRPLEVEAAASSGPGADDGFITIRRLDNGAFKTVTGVDNDIVFEGNRQLLGLLNSIEPWPGIFCLDDFASFR
jgi:hypothetical protein